MTNQHVLLQYGEDPFNTTFEDLEGRLAFTVTEVEQNPNLLVKLTREAPWSKQHPQIMGPNNSFLYFGPEHTSGYLVYGNGPTQPMTNSIRRKREGSTYVRSRYFTAQNGKELKWKITPQRMECLDGRSVVAVWERSEPEDLFNARLTIKAPGLAIVTEILTSLELNHISTTLRWQT